MWKVICRVMEPRIIRGDELKKMDFGDTKVTNIINDVNEFSKFSIVRVDKVGDDIKLGLDKESDVAYYVLEGEGICVIEDKEFVIKKGDLVLIPHGTKYKNLKGLTLLAIASPPYDRNKREYF
jgi:mannose-6-phosphate isomerase-like protein (cupin superfamily)